MFFALTKPGTGASTREVPASVCHEADVGEAKRHVRKAIGAGLVPIVGKAHVDNFIFSIKDTLAREIRLTRGTHDPVREQYPHSSNIPVERHLSQGAYSCENARSLLFSQGIIIFLSSRFRTFPTPLVGSSSMNSITFGTL